MALHKLEGVLKPRKRPVGLLLDTADDLMLTDDRWQRGVEFAAYGCDGMSRGPLIFCADDEVDDEHGTDSVGDTVRYFGAFDVYLTATCSARDVDYDYLAERIDGRWDPMLSEPIAAELEHGGNAPEVPDGAGDTEATPTLQNSAAIGTPYAGTIDEAFAAIEYGLATTLHGAVGLIHVAPFLLAAAHELIERDPATGNWVTHTGHTVVSDAGYLGVAPSAVEGEPDPSSRWIYGSGPVAYQIGAPSPRPVPVEGFNRARNEFTARKVAQALYIFDPCSVFAAEFTLAAGS